MKKMNKKLFALLSILVLASMVLAACGGAPTSTPTVYVPLQASAPMPTVAPEVVFRAEWHRLEDVEPDENMVVPGWTLRFYNDKGIDFQSADLVLLRDNAVLGSITPLAMEGFVVGDFSLTDIENIYLRFPDGSRSFWYQTNGKYMYYNYQPVSEQ